MLPSFVDLYSLFSFSIPSPLVHYFLSVLPITACKKFYSYIVHFPQLMQTYFDAPDGIDPVALDLGSMGKGQAWVNGHHIGRYWTVVAPKGGCQDTCDYRGAYNSDKCTTNCGNPTQTW